MEKSIIKIILGISCCLLLIAGLLFIVLAIADNTQDNISVILAIGCLVLAGLFGIVHTQIKEYNV